MKFKLTKTVEAEWCTHEFLNGGKHLANHVWAIAKYKDGNYAIVHKITNEIYKEFKEKQKIYDNTWLLTHLDDTQCIMYYGEDKIKTSKSFLRLIKVFENFVLIENMEGERKLLMRHAFFQEELRWFSGEDNNWKVVRVYKGKNEFTIIKKQGLEVLDSEFDDYIFSVHIKNIVIAKKGDIHYIIRISDFGKSSYYDDIIPYNSSQNPISIVKHVIVTYGTKTKAIMDVNTFEVTDAFKTIKPMSSEYALVTNFKGKEEILRLSDYKVAKFD